MTPLRRPPRDFYRVLSEDEYLRGGDAQSSSGLAARRAPASSLAARGERARRGAPTSVAGRRSGVRTVATIATGTVGAVAALAAASGHQQRVAVAGGVDAGPLLPSPRTV